MEKGFHVNPDLAELLKARSRIKGRTAIPKDWGSNT
jgi:hypothetical protein